ncbi:MAG: DUF1679 domain-containing protein [bacterium]|nr:DUF1679 domain-containing protein [bacterium]MCP5068188.1 DUF1679 domain-containing protein [bacterium]
MQVVKSGAHQARSDFPIRAEELSSEWLNSAMRTAESLPASAKITGHHWERIGDQGYTSEVVRVHLQYNESDASLPATLVAKFAATRSRVRSTFVTGGYYEREVRFYQTLADDPGIPIPKCHAAEWDPRRGRFVLLLEDLGHCRLGRVGSAKDVELAISHLAGFHARWWGDAWLKQNPWITNSSDPTYSSGRRQLLEGVLTAVETRHADVTPGIVLEAAAQMIDLWDQVTPSVTSVLTLSHGDFRPGQLFFASEKGGRFTVSDWQTLSLNSPGSDLARIVVTGLGIQQRRSMDRSLVSHYHARLMAGGVRDLDLDSLWLLFRLALLDIVVSHLTTLLIVDARGDEGILRLGDSADESLPRAKRMEVYFAQLAAALGDYEIIELVRRQGRRAIQLS